MGEITETIVAILIGLGTLSFVSIVGFVAVVMFFLLIWLLVEIEAKLPNMFLVVAIFTVAYFVGKEALNVLTR